MRVVKIDVSGLSVSHIKQVLDLARSSPSQASELASRLERETKR